jgi:hypothetical protein
VLGLHLGAPVVQATQHFLVTGPQRVRVGLGLGTDMPGLGLRACLGLGGLVLRQPQHPLQPFAQAFQGGRRQREALDLAAHVVDLRPRDLQLPRQVGGLRHRRVPVGREQTHLTVHPFEVLLDLQLAVTALRNVEADTERYELAFLA